jgi:glycosyltransferase involved in cell wall biosynthesis
MPAYHAERTLERTYRDLPLDWVDDVILVDDASRDQTVEIARQLGIHTLVHPLNRGYGGNQKTCYREALARGADVVVMVHPDHQYDPRYIPELVTPLLAGECEAVFGSRMLGGRPLEGGMPKWKYLANLGLTAIANATFYVFLSEYHSGLRAYARRYLESVDLEANSDDFVFDTEIIAQGVWRGSRRFPSPPATSPRHRRSASGAAYATACRSCGCWSATSSTRRSSCATGSSPERGRRRQPVGCRRPDPLRATIRNC